MNAIIESGGKQYPVSPGQEVRLEKLAGEVGSAVEFTGVLAVSGDDGKLLTGEDLKSAKVMATISAQGRDKKIRVLKFKRRKQYRRHSGHRQDYTAVKIDKIEV